MNHTIAQGRQFPVSIGTVAADDFDQPAEQILRRRREILPERNSVLRYRKQRCVKSFIANMTV